MQSVASAHPCIQVYFVLEAVSDSLASVLLGSAWSCRMHAAAHGMGVRLVLMISRSAAQTQVGATWGYSWHSCGLGARRRHRRGTASPSGLCRAQMGGSLGLWGAENRWVYVEQVGLRRVGSVRGARYL